MSDIRLKTISVEPLNVLTIQRGDIRLTNTTSTTSILNGTLVTNGGIAINCSYDSVSSTSGGAITVGGGLAVQKQGFFGDNVIMDNISSVLSVNGISVPRLFLDSVTNKNFYVSPDGLNKRIDLYDTSIFINITKNSVNASSGALVISGGISINNTVNAVNSSDGGALTVAGGVAVGGDSYLSKSLTLGQENYGNAGLIIRNTGYNQISLLNSSNSNSASFNVDNDVLVISNNNDISFDTSNGSFIFTNSDTNNTLLTITGTESIFDKIIQMNDTVESNNLTTGSIVTVGGISIRCTTDAVSFTSGGALTIGGGLGVSKKTYTGDSIGIELSNSSKNNKIVLYQSNRDLTQSNLFTGMGVVSSGSLRFQIPSLSSDYVFYSATTSNHSNEVFRIKGSNEVQFMGLSQKYSVKGGGINDTSLSFQSQSIATPMSINFFTADGDTNDSVDLKIVGLGLPNSMTDSEYLKLGWDDLHQNYTISTNNSGIGIQRDLVIETGFHRNQLRLGTDGCITISSTTKSFNSSTGGLVLSGGGLSINSTTDSVSLSEGGSFTVNGGGSFRKSLFVGASLNINSNSTSNINIRSQNTIGTLLFTAPNADYVFAGTSAGNKYDSSITIYSYNNTTSGNFEALRIGSSETTISINSKSGGTGIIKPIEVNVGEFSQIFLSTSGNIGINTTTPESSAKVDLNGTLLVREYTTVNGLTINNTSESTSLMSGGSVTAQGGVSIAKQLRVGGKVTLSDTTDSSSTSAALMVSGGLTILNGQASNFGYGALTVNGGGYFGGELYVQQNLNVNGQINGGGSSSSTFAYLTLTATDEAINLSTGTLLTFGGITIQSYSNSQSVSNGGSILTPGGASIGKDLYIGGDVYNYGANNFYAGFDNLINFFDVSNIKRFSFDVQTISNDFSISRYDSLGAFIEKSIEISNNNGTVVLHNPNPSTGATSGSLITQGGITINATTDAVSLNNGGSLTMNGGASITKRLFVGGDTVFSSTSESTTTSNGSIVVSGGVGIGGNLNVLGNTVIVGNLTIIGTTTSVQSTNTLLNDNIVVLNSGPSGSKDSGLLVQRYQQDNNASEGDVVSDIAYRTDVLPNQSGMANDQVKLSTFSSSMDDYYTGWWIKITTGFSVNQVRKVTGYTGSTRIAQLSSPWTSQNPAIGDNVSLYNKPYVGLIYNETNDRFEFGSSVGDPGQTNVSFTDHLPIYFSSATSLSTQPSTSYTTGGLVLTGGISSSCTMDSSSTTSGGSLTVAGGASIAKSLRVGDSLYVGNVNITPNRSDVATTVTFSASNNVINENIIDLLFNDSTWGFDIWLSARVISTSNLYANYYIRGVNKGSSWQIVTSYVGDQIATFSITNSGQIQYSTPNIPGFESVTFKYKVLTN